LHVAGFSTSAIVSSSSSFIATKKEKHVVVHGLVGLQNLGNTWYERSIRYIPRYTDYQAR
jgi:hypothetical protein